MNKKIAVIDVGTNNILLLIVNLIDDKIKVLNRKSRISAMGRNMKDNILTEAAIRRSRAILRDFISFAKLFTENIIVIGTSCSREANNIHQITNWLQRKFDLQYHIISGEKEAYLSGLANAGEFKEIDEILLFDIGGGSTEFTFMKNRTIQTSISTKIGIRRLDEMFGYDFENKLEWVKNILAKLPIQISKQTKLIGIGGTATSISAMLNELKDYDPLVVHKSRIKTSELQKIFDHFSDYSLYQIKEIMAFEPRRAEIIETGMMIFLQVLSHFEKEEFLVSDRGIQFGVLNQNEDELLRMLN